jgi:hypothetical protein
MSIPRAGGRLTLIPPQHAQLRRVPGTPAWEPFSPGVKNKEWYRGRGGAAGLAVSPGAPPTHALARFVTEAGDWTGSDFQLSRKLAPSYSPHARNHSRGSGTSGNVRSLCGLF